MHRALLAAVALILSASSVAAAQRSVATTGRQDLVGKPFDAVISRVGDGDTLDAVPVGESRPIRIRLQGIDAPEQGEAFGREALALVRKLLFDQRVRIHAHELDRFGRLVARVVRGDADASVHLVRAGLACHAYAYDPTLAREEAQARAAGAGFWAAATRKPACVTSTAFSRKEGGMSPLHQDGSGTSLANSNPTSLHGNVDSRVYHAPHCRNYTCRNCTQFFASEADAKAAGFRPAADCLEP